MYAPGGASVMTLKGVKEAFQPTAVYWLTSVNSQKLRVYHFQCEQNLIYLSNKLKKMHMNSVTQPSESPWATPNVVVRKQNWIITILVFISSVVERLSR